jgi:hypothetical protein
MSTTNKTKPMAKPVYGKQLIWLIAAIALVAVGLVINQKLVQAADIVVYKNPSCGCCNKWVEHLQEKGYRVEVQNRNNLASIRSSLGIPGKLQSCHTAKIGNYLIEGHVPAADIERLLNDKPQVAGLAVPGMPMGSPGMEGPRKDTYQVLTFQENGAINVFNRHNQ